jgi:hypothetical protein
MKLRHCSVIVMDILSSSSGGGSSSSNNSSSGRVVAAAAVTITTLYKIITAQREGLNTKYYAAKYQNYRQ